MSDSSSADGSDSDFKGGVSSDSSDDGSDSDREFVHKASSREYKRMSRSTSIDDEDIGKETSHKPTRKLRSSPDVPTPMTSDGFGAGYLAYVFTGDQSPGEIAVFRKICMKYGLQAWDDMVAYMPWRSRAAFRTTLCHIIRKQALSEYEGIRADPFQIQQDNPLEDDGSGDYRIKGGMLINQKWERTSSEWDEMRKKNTAKYELPQSVSDTIEIPIIMSVEYMKQMCFNRKQSLLLKRAALRQEAMKRGLGHWDNLGVNDLVLAPSGVLELPETGEDLTLKKSDEGIYSLSEP